MNYKFLCSDLDGTLLSTKSDVSAFAITEIARIRNRMQVILVSARMPKSMVYVQQDLGILHEPIICYNGAYVLHGGVALASTEIDIAMVRGIFEMSQGHGIHLGLYHKNEWYVDRDSERVQKEIRYTKAVPVFRDTETTLSDWEQRTIGAHKLMLMGTKDSTDAIFPKLQDFFGTGLNLYRSNDTLIEIAPRSVSKMSAIRHLLGNRASPRDVVAFGDNYNDMEMLKNVGCGVAVGNARAEVKAIADYITLKNTEDGVAHFIQKHLVI